MTDGEAGHEPGDVGEAAAEEQEGEQEGEVIGAAEDVLDPEPHVGGERSRRRGAWRPMQDPARLALAEDALRGRCTIPRDAREV